MDACIDRDIPPYHCAMILGLPLVAEGTTEQKVAALTNKLGETLKDCHFYPLLNTVGVPDGNVLVKFVSKAFLDSYLATTVKDGVFVMDDKDYITYGIMSNYNQLEREKGRSVVHHNYAAGNNDPKVPHKARTIRSFSGADRVPKGECDIYQWLSDAREVVEHDPILTHQAMVQHMRNSLHGGALQLVSSKDIADPQEFMRLIATSYGAGHSADHLWFKFYQINQRQGEKPSEYLQRIQNEYKEIERLDPDTNTPDDRKKIIFRQFTQGLLQGYSDLLTLHIGLQDYRNQTVYQNDAELLVKVQEYETHRKERTLRLSNEPVQAAAIGTIFDYEGTEIKDPPTQVDSKLQHQIDMLKKKIDEMSNSKKQQKAKKGADVAAVDASGVGTQPEGNQPQKRKQQQHKGQGKGSRFFCLCCSQKGHVTKDCKLDFDEAALRQKVKDIQAAGRERDRKEKEAAATKNLD